MKKIKQVLLNDAFQPFVFEMFSDRVCVQFFGMSLACFHVARGCTARQQFFWFLPGIRKQVKNCWIGNIFWASCGIKNNPSFVFGFRSFTVSIRQWSQIRYGHCLFFISFLLGLHQWFSILTILFTDRLHVCCGCGFLFIGFQMGLEWGNLFVDHIQGIHT